MHVLAFCAAVAAFLAMPALAARAQEGHIHGSEAAPPVVKPIALTIPNVSVTDQTGRRLKFLDDIVGDRTVAISFIYTSCTALCPMLTANLAAVQDQLADRLGRDVALISITLDPDHDTPERLAAFAENYGARPGWSFVTGAPGEIAALLKAMNAGGGAREDHTSVLLIGHGPSGPWSRAYGLDGPKQIAAMLTQASRATAFDGQDTRQAAYFTNLPLIDQHGRTLRFYGDVMRGQVVVVTAFYTSCADVCPLIADNLRAAQALLPADTRGAVRMVGITLDADTDTRDVLQAFAANHALDGQWTLLGGKKDNVDWVLHKFGLYTEQRDDHSTLAIIGNSATGEWVKLLAMAEPRAIAAAIEKVAASGKPRMPVLPESR